MTDHQRPEALRAQFDAWFSDGFPRAVERKADGEYKAAIRAGAKEPSDG